ncbi:MAG: hypothetical protein FWC97_09525 [Treponema sp.]|nr:hypothetical protein [Treponema sp.]
MTGYKDEIITEVRENKAKLIEMYGGYSGFLKHLDEERPRLEEAGWEILNIEEVRTKNMRRQLREDL